MAVLTNVYSDLDLTFQSQPVSGDVSLVLNDRAVINSVRNLLLTNFYERLWQPGLGSGVTGLLFELVDSNMQSIIANDITNTINNFEPRVSLQSVIVQADPQNDGYNVTLTFFIGNNTQATQVNMFLQRIR
jgi:phage baseplate assembly protein W